VLVEVLERFEFVVGSRMLHGSGRRCGHGHGQRAYLPYLASRKLRVLRLSSKTPSAYLPDVTPFTSLG
jgi:hypothetical protein